MPNPACVEPKCGGLIIRVGVYERVHKKALQLARRVVKRNLRGKWKVAPLGQRVRDFAVTRVGKRGAIGVGTAWDNVYRLANDRDVVDAEPTFDIAGLEPDPEHMARQLTSWEQVSAKSSGGGSRDKRCSTAYDWSIENCRFVKAWNVPPVGGKRFGKGIKVGHPDTGYTHHPEIWNNPLGEQRVQSGYDFVDADPSAYDPLARGNPGHGTKTGSLIMSDIGFHLGAPFITGGAPEAVLVTAGVRAPTGWKTDKYGSGILDARKLLEAKLPKTPSAKGMKIFPMGGAAPTDTVMELCEYFPRRGVAAVRAALAKELRVKEINLDDFLAQFGHEVTFHVATNTAFRQSVQNRLQGLKAKSAEKNKQLGSQASRTLKRALRI